MIEGDIQHCMKIGQNWYPEPSLWYLVRCGKIINPQMMNTITVESTRPVAALPTPDAAKKPKKSAQSEKSYSTKNGVTVPSFIPISREEILSWLEAIPLAYRMIVFSVHDPQMVGHVINMYWRKLKKGQNSFALILAEEFKRFTPHLTEMLIFRVGAA
jgi:hypothetical protein